MAHRVGVLTVVGLLWPLAGVMAQEESGDRTINVPLPETASVTVQRNLVYKTVEGRDLRMDVYRPADRPSSARLPAVVFIHGGPVPAERQPTGGLKATGGYTSYSRFMAASGLAAVTFNFRFPSVSAGSKATKDVSDALSYIREHARDLSLDAHRLCVFAISGGGVFVSPLLRNPPEWLQCVVLSNTIMDPAAFEALSEDLGSHLSGVPDEFLTSRDAIEALAAADDSLPRIVVARAGRDYEALNETLDGFIGAALNVNAPLDVMNHAEAPHGWEHQSEGPRTREMIRRIRNIVKLSLTGREP